MTQSTSPYEINEGDYGHKVIKRIVEISVGGHVVAGAWKQPMSSAWSINIVRQMAEILDLPSDYLDFSLEVRDENEARRVLQFLALMYAARAT